MHTRRNLPPLNAIRSFEAVARHEHLGDAASELNVSHSALSQQVKRLEEWFQIELFSREGGRLTLNPTGEKLLGGYSKALAMIEETTGELSAEEDQKNLVIQCEPAFFNKCLIEHMPALRKAAGDTIIDIVTTRSLPRHFPDDVDIVIHFSFPPDWKDVKTKALVEVHGFPACSPELLKRHPDIKKPADILEMPLLHGDDRGSWTLWLNKYADANSSSCANTYYDDFSMTTRAAVMGEGALIADELLCADELRRGDLVPLFDDTIHEVSYSMISSRPKIKKRKVRKLYDTISRRLAGLAEFTGGRVTTVRH